MTALMHVQDQVSTTTAKARLMEARSISRWVLNMLPEEEPVHQKL